MTKYVIKRILLMFLTLFIITIMCFVLIKLLPLPAVREMGKDINLVLMRREKMGYNRPIMVQFFLYIKNILTDWDWGVGEQMYEGLEIWDVMMQKLPYTVVVNLYSILISIPLGLGLGIYAALKKNKWQDTVISTLVMVFISVPSYVYAFLVQYIFCFKLNWFPLQLASLSQAGSLFSGKMFISMVPAIMSLSFGVIAGFTRYTRAELSEVLTGDYMLLARTKGLTKAQAISRHAMRNAMVVILPMIFGEFIGILGGSMIIENIFGIPGIGNLYVNSITVRDYNFFMALNIFYTLIGLVSGIVIDISYGFIDPRIRMGSKK
ncbi:MAG: ABC transporter permease [Clostridia bacterium]|nr:ABC transporter permease [Clostridia bacterium]MBR1685912.1 ABC transporter permease [Clostridia bacterium]